MLLPVHSTGVPGQVNIFYIYQIKRILLSILSIVFLLSATELHELARVPNLIRHFLQHKEDKPNMDLSDFIVLHYSGNHPNDQDEDEDEGLPFKEQQITHIDIMDFPSLETATSYPLSLSKVIPYSMGKPLHAGSELFRPPRYV